MRLPVSKIYRAFPELDRFEDAACRRFVKEAKRAKRWSHILIGVLSVPAYFVGVFLTMRLAAIIIDAVFPRSPPTYEMLVVGFVIISAFTLPYVVLLLVRDAWLRWALKSQVSSTSCYCRYSLLGLTIEDGAVTCPECGERIVLEDRGLTPEMLLAGEL